MEISMTQAAYAAALSVLLGIFLGTVYDAVRFFRVIFSVDVSNPFGNGRITLKRFFGYVFVAFGDLLFFFVATVATCIFLFLTGDGRPRWYVLTFSALGFALYYNTVGRLFISVLHRVVFAMKKLFLKLLFPLRWLFSAMEKLYLLIFDMPIVKAALKRYNEYINKMKKNAIKRKKQKMRKKGDCFTNGGTHG